MYNHFMGLYRVVYVFRCILFDLCLCHCYMYCNIKFNIHLHYRTPRGWNWSLLFYIIQQVQFMSFKCVYYNCSLCKWVIRFAPAARVNSCKHHEGDCWKWSLLFYIMVGAIPDLSTRRSKGTHFTAESNKVLVLWYPFESNIDLFYKNNRWRLNILRLFFVNFLKKKKTKEKESNIFFLSPDDWGLTENIIGETEN